MRVHYNQQKTAIVNARMLILMTKLFSQFKFSIKTSKLQNSRKIFAGHENMQICNVKIYSLHE